MEVNKNGHPEVFRKKGALKICAKFTKKNTFARVSLINFAGLRPTTIFKKRPWERCFPTSFTKIL